MGAFRTADGSEVLEAPTREGVLKLEIAPRHVTLAIARLQVVVTEEFVSVTETRGSKVRRASERLAGSLVVARDVPHEDLALWLEREDKTMQRLFGVEPHDLIAEDGLVALRALDRLASRLKQALSPYHHGFRRAFEVGRGLDKVLVLDDDERMVVYARRLFRDGARRVLEVHADGGVVVPGRTRDARFRVRDRFGITVTGDRVRFLDPEGTDLGRVALPWIEPEDRIELARRFGEMVERSLPESQRVLAAAIDVVSPGHRPRGRREPPGLRMLHRPRLRPR
jgi:hypothetical protein